MVHERLVRFNGNISPPEQFYFSDFSTIQNGQTRWASLAGEKFGVPIQQHQSMTVLPGFVGNLDIVMITPIPDGNLFLRFTIDGIPHPKVLIVSPLVVGSVQMDVYIPFESTKLINMEIENTATVGTAEFVAAIGIIWV